MKKYIRIEKGIGYEDANDLKFTLITLGFSNVTTVVSENTADVIITEGTRIGQLEYILDELKIKGYTDAILVDNE